jgi:hypothetical protein
MGYYMKKAKKVDGGYLIAKCPRCGIDIIFRGGSYYKCEKCHRVYPDYWAELPPDATVTCVSCKRKFAFKDASFFRQAIFCKKCLERRTRWMGNLTDYLKQV